MTIKLVLFQFIYSLIQKKFSKIIMISKEILDNASFKDNVYDKTVIINNVVDKDKIIRMSNEFNTCKYDLIFVGRLNDIKKPLLFIDIVNDLCRNNFNIKACIIGDGDLYLSCKNKIKNENLESNIDLLGFQTNPFPYVKNSKVLVMPSGYEGLGLVAIESMVLGTIVVNSGVGGLRTIFNNHSKYICNNKEDYVKCIVKLLKNDNCVYKKDCNEMAKKFTDLDQYKNKIINLYKEIIK